MAKKKHSGRLKSKVITTSKEFKEYGIPKEYDAAMFFEYDDEKKSKGLKKQKRQQNKATKKNGIRKIVGYAGTKFKDRVKDVIPLSTWKKAKNDLLQPGANTSFFNHDTDKPIGKVLKTVVDDVGLLVDVMISKAKDVEDIWTKIEEGILNALSIRLRPKKVKVIEDEESGRIKEFRILDMELFEVSVVGLPANAKATINDVIGKSLAKANKQRRSNRMATKKKSRKSKSKKSTKRQKDIKQNGMTSAEFKKALAASNKSLGDTIAAGIGEAMKSVAATQMSAKDRKKAKKAKEKRALDKALKESPVLAAIYKKLDKDDDSDRKGGQDDGKEPKRQKGVPEKCLEDVEDVKTAEYVCWLMGDGDKKKYRKRVWKGLKPEEQEAATEYYGIYLMSADLGRRG